MSAVLKDAWGVTHAAVTVPDTRARDARAVAFCQMLTFILTKGAIVDERPVSDVEDDGVVDCVACVVAQQGA